MQLFSLPDLSSNELGDVWTILVPFHLSRFFLTLRTSFGSAFTPLLLLTFSIPNDCFLLKPSSYATAKRDNFLSFFFVCVFKSSWIAVFLTFSKRVLYTRVFVCPWNHISQPVLSERSRIVLMILLHLLFEGKLVSL